MVLPEPERGRPTVALDRKAVPGQGAPGRAREDHARADRALQDRVRAERANALLETSPFWQSEEQRTEAPPRELPPGTGKPPRHRPREPRRPVSGLPGAARAGTGRHVLRLGQRGAVLARGRARPPGHRDDARCNGDGVTQRCTGQFASADGGYTVPSMTLFGVTGPAGHRARSARPGWSATDSRQAYAGDAGILVHLRWSAGLPAGADLRATASPG